MSTAEIWYPILQEAWAYAVLHYFNYLAKQPHNQKL